MSDEKKVLVVNAVGIVVLALGMFGIEVGAETKADLIAGIAALGCVINAALAGWEARKNA